MVLSDGMVHFLKIEKNVKGNQIPHIKFTFIIKYSLLRTTSESLSKIRQRIRKLQLFEI